MRKTLLSFLMVVCLFSFVFADRNAPTITGYSSSTLIKRGDGKVYWIDFIATSNSGNFTLSDNTEDNVSTTNVMTEGSEATANNGKHYDFTNKPLEFSTGIYLTVSNAKVVIAYE